MKSSLSSYFNSSLDIIIKPIGKFDSTLSFFFVDTVFTPNVFFFLNIDQFYNVLKIY